MTSSTVVLRTMEACGNLWVRQLLHSQQQREKEHAAEVSMRSGVPSRR